MEVTKDNSEPRSLTETQDSESAGQAYDKWRQSFRESNAQKDVLPASLIGRQLGDFVLEQSIGEGGYGSVFKARQRGLDREAVIKIPKVQLDGEHAERFIREAKIASRIDHPYAAHVYAFGVEPDGLTWIAMEYVAGVELSDVLDLRGAMPVAQFVPLFSRLCEVVERAHDNGIVHCDIKPANVMVLSRAGQKLPKLLDLGVARALQSKLAQDIEAKPAASAATQKGQSGQSSSLSGSPPYMAPEQWSRNAEIDHRVDIYALAVLAYEMLNGERPFRGKNTWELAYAHAKHPIPTVRDTLPDALNEVFEKALAKRRDARYSKATEFAADLARAAGFTTNIRLPQFSSATRQKVYTEAPYPIATVFKTTEQSSTGSHALHNVRHLLATASHYMGLLALAGRSQIGKPQDGDAQEVGEHLRNLRERSLSAEEWLDLSVAVTEPYKNQRELFPLPDLVAFMRSDDVKLIRQILKQPIAPGATEREMQARYKDVLPQVETILASLQFLNYCIPVSTHGGNRLRWAGLQPSDEHADLTAELGKVVAVDADGSPILSLAPLIRATSPFPEAAPTLFMLQGGNNAAGAALVTPLESYRIHDGELWDWVAQNILENGEGVEGSAHASEDCPYRGLDTYTESDSALYFGREKETDVFLNRLRKQPIITVAGPSGSGKSSFLRAGVVPRLRNISIGTAFRSGDRAWKTIYTRPGNRPLESLASMLRSLDISPERANAEMLVNRAEANRNHYFIVIDQFEELFTQGHSPEEQTAYVDKLLSLAASENDPIRLCIVLRDDFLARAERLPSLRGVLSRGLLLLTTPAANDLERILFEPARHSGYDFEDRELARDMIAGVAEEPAALALLSFAAASLWTHRDRHFNKIPRKAFKTIGGVAGALARHADATLEQCSAEQRKLMRAAFSQLVTAEGTRAVLTREELLKTLESGDTAEELLEHLISARLVMTSESDNSGDQRVEIVHETLISAWPTLVEWRREDAEGTRFRDQLRDAARQWNDRGRPRGLLWRGDALAEFRQWRERYQSALDSTSDAFTVASVTEAKRSQKVRRSLVVSALSILSAALVVVLYLNHRADAARDNAQRSQLAAESSLADSLWQQARLALIDGRYGEALRHAQEAESYGKTNRGLAYIKAAAKRSLGAQKQLLNGHKAGVYAAVMTPQSDLMVTLGSDATLRTWSADGTPIHTVQLSGAGTQLKLASDGTRAIVSGGPIQAPTLVDIKSGKVVRTLPLASRSWRAAFSHDSVHVVTTQEAGPSQVWNAANGELVAKLDPADKQRGHSAAVFAGGTLILATQDGSISTWNAADWTRKTITQVHDMVITDLAVDNANRHVASFDTMGRIAVVDVATGQRRWSKDTLESIDEIAWHPTKDQVISTGADGGISLWDNAGKKVKRLDGHDGRVLGVAVAPSGDLLASAGEDGTARVWSLNYGVEVAKLSGHTAQVNDVQWLDASRLVTASSDRSVRTWNANAARAHRILATETQYTAAVAVTPNGETAIIGSRETTSIEFFDVASGAALGKLVLSDASAAAFAIAVAPNSKLAAVSFYGDGVYIVDIQRRAIVRRLVTGRDDPTGLAFSAQGDTLFIGDHSGALASWSVANGTKLQTWKFEAGINAIALSPSGSTLAIADMAGFVKTLAIAEGNITEIGRSASNVVDVAFNHDGTQIAGPSLDGKITLWNVAAKKPHVVLAPAEVSRAFGARYSDDGRLLYANSDNGMLDVYDVTSGEQIHSIQTFANLAMGRVAVAPNAIVTAGENGARIIPQIPGMQQK